MPWYSLLTPVVHARWRGVRGPRSLVCVVAAGLAAVLLAAPARAVPVGEPFTVIGQGRNPDVAFNAVDGRYLVEAWEPGRGGFHGVRVVSVAATGEPDVRPAGRPGARAWSPQMALDPVRNRFLVAYVEVPQIGPAMVMVALFAADGTRPGGPTAISPALGAPQVAHNSRSGEYLVVSGDSAQRISADGVPVGEPTRLSIRAADIAYRPATDDFVVVSGTGLLARMSASGVQTGDALRFDDGLGAENPAIVAQPRSPRAVVTWANSSGVYARALVGEDATPTRLRRIAPEGRDSAIAYNARARQYLVVWTAGCQTIVCGASGTGQPGQGPSMIRGQHLTRVLQEIGPDDFQISNPVTRPGWPAAPNQFTPAVAADSTSPAYLAAWTLEIDPVFGFFSVLGRRLTTVTDR